MWGVPVFLFSLAIFIIVVRAWWCIKINRRGYQEKSTMRRYRKKPIIVEAIQFWNDKPWPDGVCDCGDDPMHFGTAHIHTKEGIMDVPESWWVITGIKGERYPCAPDIFETTYEAVEPIPNDPIKYGR